MSWKLWILATFMWLYSGLMVVTGVLSLVDHQFNAQRALAGIVMIMCGLLLGGGVALDVIKK